MRKTFFISPGKSYGYLLMIIIGLISSISLILFPLLCGDFEIVIFSIFFLIALVVLGLCMGIIRSGFLSNIVISDEGITKRKFLKPNNMIEWGKVERAETVRLSNTPVPMIAIEGYDEFSCKKIIIYLDDLHNTRKLLKESIKKYNDSKLD